MVKAEKRMRIVDVAKDISFSELKNESIRFGAFYFLMGIVSLVLNSFFLFIHFFLENNLGVIDSWLEDKAWFIICFTKVIAASIYSLFWGVKKNSRLPFADLFKNKKKNPTEMFFVIIVVFLLLHFFIGDPVLNRESTLTFFDVLKNTFFIICFYLIDFFILMIVFDLVDSRNFSLKSNLLRFILYPILFYLCNENIFSFASSMNFLIAIAFFWILYLYLFFNQSFVCVVLIIVCLFVPLGIFFGISPVIQKTSSVIILQSPLTLLEYIVVSILFVLFMNKKELRLLLQGAIDGK